MLKQYEFGFKRFLGNPVMVGSSRTSSLNDVYGICNYLVSSIATKKDFLAKWRAYR
jgi:hypothetical protein